MTSTNSYQLALIGEPVAHCLSPLMHDAALRALGLAGEYRALAVPPAQLEAALCRLIASGYRGFNVTLPHKQAVVPMVHELSAAARSIGAVNTVVVDNGRLSGHNTDALGFMRGLTQTGFQSAGKRALVLGAGGAARAVVFALTQAGARVSIWNHTGERAERLARDFYAQRVQPDEPLRLHEYDLLVNATSIGMSPQNEQSPTAFDEHASTPACVYDLVYSPRETRLLREARARGAQTIGGIEMLLQQGAEAFRLWTGREAPLDAMREAIGDDSCCAS